MNLEARIKAAQADLANDKLSLILMGAPSGGKSRCMGTIGVKTLFVYFGAEKHGPASAVEGGSEIVPFCVDIDEKGEPVDPDKAYDDLVSLLNNVAWLKANGIKAIAIDGASELENLITSTSVWKARVQSTYKGVESYAGPITVSMFRPVLDALRFAQSSLGVHYVISCILNIQEYGDNGVISEASPKLAGFQVVGGVLQQIPDRLIIGHVDINGKSKPRLQIGAYVSKSTKDFKTKEVTKLSNFRCQLQGVDLTEGPETLTPNLANVIAYKAAKKIYKIEKPKE